MDIKMEIQSTLTELKGGKETMEHGFEQGSIDRYVNLYNEVMTKVGDGNIACMVIHEIGKDTRLRRIQESEASRSRGNESNGLASDKQKNYLRRLGVEFDENISKREASRLIDESVGGEA